MDAPEVVVLVVVVDPGVVVVVVFSSRLQPTSAADAATTDNPTNLSQLRLSCDICRSSSNGTRMLQAARKAHAAGRRIETWCPRARFVRCSPGRRVSGFGRPGATDMVVFDALRNVAVHVGHERQMRLLLEDCRRLLSERGEANSSDLARSLVERFERLPAEQQGVFFGHLDRDFAPDPQEALQAAQDYARAPGPETLLGLVAASEPPRQELLRRINRIAGGTAHIVAMRAALLERLRESPALRAIDSDFQHLLSSWFNPGFLTLQRVDWSSPAQLLEQIIRHEAVHAIDGWEDLRRRLQPDRRCFAFFHPQLPREPLIFVEVALVADMPRAIAPLLDRTVQPGAAEEFRVACFYSISNCQPGLRGVSLGNFLIKRVAEELKRELPQLRTFCTLSPIPGFARWLATGGTAAAATPAQARRLALARERLLAFVGGDLERLHDAAAVEALDADAAHDLCALAAAYLALHSAAPGGDPVARFHLDNGARLERLDPLADRSAKGLRQSHGMMVNYLYDLDAVEADHERFVAGEVVASRAVRGLL
jgi:malonyl-CoA decarboxylase